MSLGIESVEPTDGGVTLNYNVSAEDNGDFTFHQVSVHGYGPNGMALCADSVGALHSKQHHKGRLRCSSVPQVIALDASDSDADTDNPGGVRVPIYRYAGYEPTHGHEWTFFREREITKRDDEFRFAPLPPSGASFEQVKCEQRVAGTNVSALGEAPWMTAEVGEPEIERTFEVHLWNATSQEEREHGRRLANRSAVFESLVREFERQNDSTVDGKGWVRAKLNRSEWLDTLGAFDDSNVSNATDLPDRSVDSYRSDSRSELCWDGGGDFGGKLQTSGDYVVILDGRPYYVLLEFTEEWH